MNHSPQLQRALVLLEQGRHELAEKELRHHLAESPRDGFALSLLAITLLEQERRDEAEQTAKEGILAAPDLAYTHFALARVLSDRNREPEAAEAIKEAIRLDPTDADYHCMHAGIELDRRNWPSALEAAETGLQFDPEHVGCNNLRAMALVKLGRKAEAGATISGTLARDPDNASSHANQGWTFLESGNRKQAMHHFRESLRIDPDNDWAKQGLVEAIKAGNPFYAVMLRYFLWMQKLSPGARWGILLGGYFGNRILSGLARANPSLKLITTPLLAIYLIFAISTWLAQPVFNLCLFLHPFGRHALNDEQRAQARWIGLCIGLALASVAAWVSTGWSELWVTPALVFGLLSMPLAAVHYCHAGWPRWTMAGLTALIALAGFGAIALDVVSVGHKAGDPLFSLFVIGVFLSQWIANWLMSQRPAR
jgi:tetratricopeptide (TPR) repeat protein